MPTYRLQLLEVQRIPNTAPGARQTYRATGKEHTLPKIFRSYAQAAREGQRAMAQSRKLLKWKNEGITLRWVVLTEEQENDTPRISD